MKKLNSKKLRLKLRKKDKNFMKKFYLFSIKKDYHYYINVNII